jgi:hypothetical protein
MAQDQPHSADQSPESESDEYAEWRIRDSGVMVLRHGRSMISDNTAGCRKRSHEGVAPWCGAQAFIVASGVSQEGNPDGSWILWSAGLTSSSKARKRRMGVSPSDLNPARKSQRTMGT